MKKISAIIFTLAVLFSSSLSIAETKPIQALKKPSAALQPPVKSRSALRLKSVSPEKGRLVKGAGSFALAGRTTELVCCENWNTSTGGTNCATYDDSEGSCPGNTFQVDCGANGCW